MQGILKTHVFALLPMNTPSYWWNRPYQESLWNFSQFTDLPKQCCWDPSFEAFSFSPTLASTDFLTSRWDKFWLPFLKVGEKHLDEGFKSVGEGKTGSPTSFTRESAIAFTPEAPQQSRYCRRQSRSCLNLNQDSTLRVYQPVPTRVLPLPQWIPLKFDSKSPNPLRRSRLST